MLKREPKYILSIFIQKLVLLIVLINFSFQLPAQTIIPGAYSTDVYLPLLANKRVALVANQTSVINNIHLADSLLKHNINIVRIFCPEHGFRGTLGAGEKVKTQTDINTGIKLVSLYGKNYKPKASDLNDIDIVVFDIQDVGVRFYTYISTLHYVMEACAENNLPLIVLDRPNPNGFYVDGPVLEPNCKSFVGIHPIPIVYGLTIGELAGMINGEAWLLNGITCNLKVIKCQNYTHNIYYTLPVNPSPNLTNMHAVYLYPSLALFEGTCISLGRGTSFPFQTFGHPNLDSSSFTFTPKKLSSSPSPPFKNTLCKGVDLRNHLLVPDSSNFTLKWLIFAYKHCPNKANFFNPFFKNLVGNELLKIQIINNTPYTEIVKTWQPAIDKYLQIRRKYLLYP